MGYKQRVDVNSLVGLNGKGILVYGVDAVNNSIYNILGCLLGTRGYHPDYGCVVAKYLWEPCTPFTAQKIRMALMQAIESWEPDVILDIGRTIIAPNPQANGYEIQVTYRLREDNSEQTALFNISRDDV